MILGISLVVDELNKGPRLVFSYPDQHSIFHRHNIPGVSYPHHGDSSLLENNNQNNQKEYQSCLSFVDRMYQQYFHLW